MFGFITVNRKQLSPAELEAYRAGYCGVCHALRQRYGSKARLLLSFDMCFVALLLSALYEEEETVQERHRCPFHPLKTLPRARNAFMDYGADMSVLLRYYHCLDQWRDEGKQQARLQAERLGRQLPRLETLYPRQYKAAADYVRQLSALEESGEQDLDQAANLTGALMAEILAYREDEWAPCLRRIGFFLGKFIYAMDAYADLERDRKRGCYNPLLHRAEESGFEEFCREYLTDLLAQASLAYERLPIVDAAAAGLLRNVLYSGVWSGYEQLQARREKRRGNKTRP